jgi:uncharacterized protein YjbI with pentapeptide repeats
MTIEYCKIDKPDWKFYKCSLRRCVFQDVVVPASLGSAFRECNFSGAHFSAEFDFNQIDAGNFYLRGKVPNCPTEFLPKFVQVDDLPEWRDHFYLNQTAEHSYV